MRRDESIGNCGKCLAFTVVFFTLIYVACVVSTHPASPFLVVTHASLNRFDFTANDNTLHYDLFLNVTARNPNPNYGVHYYDVRLAAFWSPVAAYSYSDRKNVWNQVVRERKKFAVAGLESFYQGQSASTTLPPLSLKGKQLVILSTQNPNPSNNANNDSSNPNGEGDYIGSVYDIIVELHFRNGFRKFRWPWMFRGCFVGSWKQTSTFVCDLEVPLITQPANHLTWSTNGTTSVAFKPTQCVRSHEFVN